MLDGQNKDIHILTRAELETAQTGYILTRMLSTKAAIPEDSVLTQKDGAASLTFPCIGAGQTGTVFALTGTSMVIKLPNSVERSDSLFNDYMNHARVCEAFHSVSVALQSGIHVPARRSWVAPQSRSFWDTRAVRFPQGVQDPNYGLVSDRIYPLPGAVRSAPVDTFAPKEIRDNKAEFLRIPKNKDCLVRLYLGRRNESSPPAAADKFHLRNFPLHVNEMEQLKLDTSHYARLMAQALAIVHWRAGLDANDVEFVLGRSPTFSASPTMQDLANVDKDSAANLCMCDFNRCRFSVWLLDFNLCGSFTEDEAGLKKLVDGFYWNK